MIDKNGRELPSGELVSADRGRQLYLQWAREDERVPFWQGVVFLTADGRATTSNWRADACFWWLEGTK